MEEPTNRNLCADCPCRSKSVMAVLLIVMGMILLKGEILRMNDQ